MIYLFCLYQFSLKCITKKLIYHATFPLKNRTNICCDITKICDSWSSAHKGYKCSPMFHLLQVKVLARQLLRLMVPRLPTQLVIEVFASVVVSQATSADTAHLILVISKLVREISRRMYNFVLTIKSHENFCAVAPSMVLQFQPSDETRAVAV